MRRAHSPQCATAGVRSIKRGFADTDKGQIYFYEQGEGPALILLHPSPQSGRVYWRLAPKLAQTFRVIVPDTLGFGLSDPLPPDATMPGLADCIAKMMDIAGVDKANIFGFHTGNKIATALASGHPNRVDRLILCGQTHTVSCRTNLHAFQPSARSRIAISRRS